MGKNIMKSTVYCYICNENFINIYSFLSHHRWYHNGISTKEYYDKYLKKNEEGICLTSGCGKQCNFYNLTKGYHKHCSRECSKKDPEVRKQFGKADNNRKKAKETLLNKYGVDNISKLDSIKKKKEETSLKNNGYKYYVGTKEHREWMKNGGAAYCNQFITNPSKPQIELYKRCCEVFPYVQLNYPCGSFSIDIAVPKLDLAFEYDGSYWHKDKKYDYRRQRYLEACGWKIIRFEDRIPNIEELRKGF